MAWLDYSDGEVESFHPVFEEAANAALATHQLRHSASERFEREFGYETARVLLGHRSVNTTKLYAAGDEGRAVKAAGLVG